MGGGEGGNDKNRLERFEGVFFGRGGVGGGGGAGKDEGGSGLFPVIFRWFGRMKDGDI